MTTSEILEYMRIRPIPFVYRNELIGSLLVGMEVINRMLRGDSFVFEVSSSPTARMAMPAPPNLTELAPMRYQSMRVHLYAYRDGMGPYIEVQTAQEKETLMQLFYPEIFAEDPMQYNYLLSASESFRYQMCNSICRVIGNDSRVAARFRENASRIGHKTPEKPKPPKPELKRKLMVKKKLKE
jgi:hypothetical protein